MRNNYAYVNENMFIIIKYYIFREIEKKKEKKSKLNVAILTTYKSCYFGACVCAI